MSGTQSKGAGVVLVHGGFVDGSGWEAVYGILRKNGFKVSIVQNPTISLAEDVHATIRVISEQDGPVVLAGHSHGGTVITHAGVEAAAPSTSSRFPDSCILPTSERSWTHTGTKYAALR